MMPCRSISWPACDGRTIAWNLCHKLMLDFKIHSSHFVVCFPSLPTITCQSITNTVRVGIQGSETRGMIRALRREQPYRSSHRKFRSSFTANRFDLSFRTLKLLQSPKLLLSSPVLLIWELYEWITSTPKAGKDREMTGFYCGARMESGPTEAQQDVPMTGFEGFGRVSTLHSRHLSDNHHRRSDFGPIHNSFFSSPPCLRHDVLGVLLIKCHLGHKRTNQNCQFWKKVTFYWLRRVHSILYLARYHSRVLQYCDDSWTPTEYPPNTKCLCSQQRSSVSPSCTVARGGLQRRHSPSTQTN
jgi:hypothetical protein